eukprot:CAMPEP_0115690930 /NCGR_PEP_ID=MMETSP0272-20121206/62381_1 /TAXON_ID=71861 /ORGANISM="Scrippsiella trochoidea, Strain CCMP3099" /LENGTH=355 /DNA_ID=CAMNT_0003130867 /DNA_START=170 /DNA_END=1234 /DNA_ORIENTATION=+
MTSEAHLASEAAAGLAEIAALGARERAEQEAEELDIEFLDGEKRSVCITRRTSWIWAMYLSTFVLLAFACFAYLQRSSPTSKENNDLALELQGRRLDVPSAPFDEQGHDDLLRGCSSILFDLGANKGTHVRKLFEPQKYPHAKVLKIYDEFFGDVAHRVGPSSETGLCAYGFEANPLHVRTLQLIEHHYLRVGWSVKFIVPKVVSTVDDKEVTLSVDRNVKHASWGTSAARGVIKGANHVLVRTIDFPAFLRRALAARSHDRPGRVLVKMDIEGSEFEVLPVLLENGDLCTGKIDRLLVEFHAFMRKGHSFIHKVLNHTCGSFSASSFDDESYLMDGRPLPCPPGGCPKRGRSHG